jgi:glycosyltransferase involved in cell wall biosynthesis
VKESFDISVIVPSCNSAATLESCLTAIRNSSVSIKKLIVVDDSSEDNSVEIAKRFADEVVEFEGHGRIMDVRFAGFSKGDSKILVNIDSDVLVKNDTLEKVLHQFSHSPDLQILTGKLAIETPQGGFFSQYKNLYMNYTFSQLPERVSFLYGSIFALRSATEAFAREQLLPKCHLFPDDTELGLLFRQHGYEIAYDDSIQVIHLKEYSFFSILKNDFNIPRKMAHLLSQYGRSGQVGKNRYVFTHTSIAQVLAIGFAYLTMLAIVFGQFLLAVCCLIFWLLINLKFFLFIGKHESIGYLISSVAFTFVDQLVMGSGVAYGTIERLKRKFKG